MNEKPHTPRYTRKQAGERRQLLIDAAIRCLGAGGMPAFTIERICKEAGVSRGLINHHFAGKEELLVCVYDELTAFLIKPHDTKNDSPVGRLTGLIDANFAQNAAEPSQLRAWLALWGEVSTNPKLQKLHRERYAAYKSAVANAISGIAAERGKAVDADSLARTLISLIDGLWLECSLDPTVLTPDAAKSACFDLLNLHLGPVLHHSERNSDV